MCLPKGGALFSLPAASLSALAPQVRARRAPPWRYGSSPHRRLHPQRPPPPPSASRNARAPAERAPRPSGLEIESFSSPSPATALECPYYLGARLIRRYDEDRLWGRIRDIDDA